MWTACFRKFLALTIPMAVIFFPAKSTLAHVQLDSPNGGETLEENSTFTILWHITIDHGPSIFNLNFSSDGGGTWTPIVQGLPYEAESYDWTVPNIESDQCLVQVHMNTNVGPDYYDQSDAPFSIVSAGILLEEPFPGLPGMLNTLTVTGATPGARVFFVFGFQPGSTLVPGCPGVAVGIENPHIAGSATANQNGEATLTVYVPNAASGLTVVLQAVERARCTVSNPVIYTFP